MTITVEIRGAVYDLDRRALPGPVRHYRVVRRDGGGAYEVLIGRHQSACTCPAWVYRPHDRPCKHVARIEEYVMTEESEVEEKQRHLPAAQPALPPATQTMQFPLAVQQYDLSQLAAGLLKAQQVCKAARKDAYNNFHRYHYASSEAVIIEGRAALAEGGLALMPIEQVVNGHEAKGADRYELVRKFLLIHTSGQARLIAVAWPIVEDKGRPLDKATAIASTLSLSFLLRDLLLMPRVDDSDEAAGRDDRPAQQQEPQQHNGTVRDDDRAGRDAPVNTARVDRIMTVVNELHLDHAALSRRLQAHYGVDSLARLTQGQADEVEERLKTARQERDIAAAARK